MGGLAVLGGLFSGSTARIASAKYRRNRRSYIVAAGNIGSQVPRWLSRRHWLEDLSRWAFHEGAELLQQKMTPKLLLSVAEVLAQFCDSTDGRHCAVTNRTVAQLAHCSERTVTNVRSILSASGFAVLAQQGCGGGGRPHRVAVWHLVSRRRPVDSTSTCDLPPSRRDRGLSHPGMNKPKARPHASRTRSTHRRRPPAARSPRPLATQRLAADLVRRTHGLGGGHIGAICDALQAVGIDPTRCTADQICRQLNSDMRETGWSWPDEIHNPAAFLTHRLARIADRLTPPQRVEGGVTAARSEDAPGPARNAVRLRQMLRAEEDCSVCGAEEAPRRPWLPPRRAHVCDPCWTIAGQEREIHAQAAGAGL